MNIMGVWYEDYPPISLGTFGLQLGYHLNWALDSSWRSTEPLSSYSAATLPKIASRFWTALSSVSNVHLCSCPLIRFCTLYFVPWRWIPFMLTCSVLTLPTVYCQGFSDWRGFFLTKALAQFLFEFRLQRIDVASVVSGVSVFWFPFSFSGLCYPAHSRRLRA